MKGINKWW